MIFIFHFWMKQTAAWADYTALVWGLYPGDY